MRICNLPGVSAGKTQFMPSLATPVQAGCGAIPAPLIHLIEKRDVDPEGDETGNRARTLETGRGS